MKQKIIDIKAHNFGPISDLQADFTTGDILVVKGGNASGKTSFIEGLWDILRQQFPKCPLKKGATEGYYSVTITDGTTIEYNAATGALTLTDANKEQMGKAVAKNYLKSLVGDLGGGFDIDTFIHTTAAKPRREMLGKLTGQSGSDIGEIEKAQADYVARFNDRTEASQKLTAQKARAVPYDAELAAKSPVDAADLSRQKSEIEAHNAKVDRANSGIGLIENDLASYPETRASLEADKLTTKTDYETELARLKTNFDAAINRLDERIGKINESEIEAKKRLEDGKKWLSDPANKPKDTEAIDTQLADLTVTNAAIDNAKRLKAEADTLASLKTVADKKEKAVTAARDAKLAAIKKAVLPAGLAFDPDSETGLLLNGQPIERASSAELTIAALQCATRGTGALHWIHVDCKALDFVNFGAVCEWLKSQKWQALLEKPAQNESELPLQFHVV